MRLVGGAGNGKGRTAREVGLWEGGRGGVIGSDSQWAVPGCARRQVLPDLGKSVPQKWG